VSPRPVNGAARCWRAAAQFGSSPQRCSWPPNWREAFRCRGHGDFFFSHDREAPMAVVDGRASLLEECRQRPASNDCRTCWKRRGQSRLWPSPEHSPRVPTTALQLGAGCRSHARCPTALASCSLSPAARWLMSPTTATTATGGRSHSWLNQVSVGLPTTKRQQ